MGLLKDIWDILKSEPEVKKTIQDQLLKFLNPRVFAKKPTLEERKQNFKLLILKLTEPNFSEKFEEKLDFYGALLAMIVETAYIKEKGCLIRNFYSENLLYYFPSPNSEPTLRKGETTDEKEKVRFIELEDKRKYIFYALKSDNLDYKSLNSKLEKIVRRSGNETKEFLEELKKDNVKVIELSAILKFNNHPGYKFFTGIFSEKENEEIKLIFENPELTKKLIAEDLNELIEFSKE